MTPLSDTTKRECPCGARFIASRKDRRFCSRNCQRASTRNCARSVKRANNEVEFIGVDGEGVGKGRNHKYVLIGCGDRQVENPQGLHWREILSFLYECFSERPSAVYVGFFLGYDFAQWFKSLPAERAWRIFTKAGYAMRKRDGGKPPLPVDVDDWQIDALPNLKRVRFRPAGASEWMYVCDAGPFFQTSLLKVIDPKEWNVPVVTPEEYELVKKGKEHRATAELDDDMRYYNRLENDILARVMVRYNQGLTKAGVKLTRKQWFGPGQCSQKWLRNERIPTGDEIRATLPKGLHEFAIASYYAGWFEIPCHGYVPGELWEYDINSAYPYVMANLPCLLHGKWTHGRGPYPDRKDTRTLTLVRARVEGSSTYLGAMLHRCQDGTRLCRPRRTAGHYWVHELDAARNAGLVDSVHVQEWWQYECCDCPPPLKGMERLYAQRLEIGKDTPEGKAYKLIYNSAYGKFAQSVGEPVFSNAIYASLITAGCRSMILDAIASHPLGAQGVAMVATDAVYFLRRHPTLSIGSGLGQWDEKKKKNVTLFKPGVYWDDKAREALAAGPNQSPVFKARGINSRDFARCLTRIDNHFKEWGKGWVPVVDDEMKSDIAWALDSLGIDPDDPSVNASYDSWDWPEVDFPVEFSMTTIGQALQWGKWEECGRVHHDVNTHQSAWDMTKRDPTSLYHDPVYKVWRTKNWQEGGTLESTPYDKTFGETFREEQWTEALTPDGPLSILFSSAIRG